MRRLRFYCNWLLETSTQVIAHYCIDGGAFLDAVRDAGEAWAVITTRFSRVVVMQ